MERLMTLQEVSTLLGSSDPKGRFVRNLRTNGILQGIKVGRKLLFKEEDVQEYIERLYALQNKKMAIRGSHSR